MLTLLSDSFILATRMDAFSYVQGPSNDMRRAEDSGRQATGTMSVPARAMAAIRRALTDAS